MNPATVACDGCLLDNFCKSCHRKDLVSCRCPDCIQKDMDCAFCADQWYKDKDLPDDEKILAKVCMNCFSGYCKNCAVTDNDNFVRCPRCFNGLSEIEKEIAELEILGSSGPHAAVPVRRRRRVNDETENKPKERVKRPDNVLIDDISMDKSIKTHAVNAMQVLVTQAKTYLSKKYRIQDAEKFLDVLFETRSEILGSFVTEIMLGDRWDNSDLDIYCTETAYERLKPFLAKEYVLTFKDGMDHINYIRYVDTWDLQNTRVQFIIMSDTKFIPNYLALADITVCQNRFTGREFLVADDRTLSRQGIVHGDPTTDRVKLYWQRGFDLQINITEKVAERIFT